MGPPKVDAGVVPLSKWSKRMSEVADLRILLLTYSLMEMSSSVSSKDGLLGMSPSDTLRS
jgi:hypothetical protein